MVVDIYRPWRRVIIKLDSVIFYDKSHAKR